jgi:uncharacterized membrane protein YjjB (DUF3815 family)
MPLNVLLLFAKIYQLLSRRGSCSLDIVAAAAIALMAPGILAVMPVFHRFCRTDDIFAHWDCNNSWCALMRGSW